jgi:hypothetical protein
VDAIVKLGDALCVALNDGAWFEVFFHVAGM